METNDKRSYFESLKKKLNIVDVIQRYIHLTKQGNSWVGLCPFHDDNNPSLSVSEKLQLFKCFVCETRGDVFAFVQKINHISYFQAVERVCKDFGIELEQKFAYKVQKANEINQKLFPYWDICDSIRRTYNDELLRAIEAKNPTVVNFLNKRRLTGEIVEIFQIGYAPRRNDFLTKVFLNPIDDQKIRSEYDKLLDELGYIDNKGNDFFSNRIIFPILDENENVVGFSGRNLGEDENGPKYLNSKESIIFKKADVLFNFAYNKKKDVTKIYLVEGFMEVISLWKIGITNAVALMGTSFSDHHMKLLKELSRLEEIVVCLDQDMPGQQASINVVHQLIKNKKWKISLLTKFSDQRYFKDLDEFIHNEPAEQVRKRLANSVNYFNWFTKFLLATSTVSDETTKKNDVLQKVLTEIRNFGNVLIPETLVDDLAKELRIKNEYVHHEYKKLGIPQRRLYKNVSDEVRLFNEMIRQKFDCQDPHTNQLYIVGRECFNFECKLLVLFFGNYQIIEFNKKLKRQFVYEETRAIYEKLLRNALEDTTWDYATFLQYVTENDFDNKLVARKIELMKDKYKTDQATLHCFDKLPELARKRSKVISELVHEYEKIAGCFENSLAAEKNWSMPKEQRAANAEKHYQRFVRNNDLQKKQKIS